MKPLEIATDGRQLAAGGREAAVEGLEPAPSAFDFLVRLGKRVRTC